MHGVARRAFLSALGGSALGAACRTQDVRGQLVLRLSHSMSAGPTSLHTFARFFREGVFQATNGTVDVRIFPSGTLGQEREVVQQVQAGLVDFMVSGTAIWGSVAPRLQVFDFPFLWSDWGHVHAVTAGPVGQEAADYLDATVGMRPLAWGDSFGFRQVITRGRPIESAVQLAGLKLRTIQSAIYVKAVELMGASPTPMAFGEVYTSMQTGVIDGFEHDASTTLQQHFYEVADHMALTRHIAGILGLYASTRTLGRLPQDLRDVITRTAVDAGVRQREMGPAEEAAATRTLESLGMAFHAIDATAFRPAAERLWAREAGALGVTGWLEVMRA